MEGMLRGMQRNAAVTGELQAAQHDFQTCTVGLEEGTEEYHRSLQDCHARCAERLARVVRKQRGLYVKAAQLIGSFNAGGVDENFPMVYAEACAEFTDRAPHRPAEEIASGPAGEALALGTWPAGQLGVNSPLESLEAEPAASGSLAQVHRGVLRDGTRVAVKAQYPEVAGEIDADLSALRAALGMFADKMPFDIGWLVDDFERNLKLELDFTLEAANTRVSKKQLAHWGQRVHVPKVHKEMSSASVLTTDFCDGLMKVTEPEKLLAAGLDPKACARLICAVFAEMVFVHGRVHADPHPGNVYLRAVQVDGRTEPQVVLLDHGLYHNLGDRGSGIRRDLAKFWVACCGRDAKAVRELSEKLVGGSLSSLLPMLFSQMFLVSGGSIALNDLAAVAAGKKAVPTEDLMELLTGGTGTGLAGLVHSLGYVRGLLDSLGLAEHERVECMLRYAHLGIRPDGAEGASVTGADGRAILTPALETSVWRNMLLLRVQMVLLTPVTMLTFCMPSAVPGAAAWAVAALILLAVLLVLWLCVMRAVSAMQAYQQTFG